MRGLAVACALMAPACQHSGGLGGDGGDSSGGDCTPACGDGLVCRYAACVATPAACAGSSDCRGDERCDDAAKECLPWGVGGSGVSDPQCQGEPAPGVFFPELQCQWLGPPLGDAYPGHVNVLATPMVATFGAGNTPSIVFTAYNFIDNGLPSCGAQNPDYFGVIRVIDGRTCEPQATIASPSVIGSAPLAIGDLAGDPTPEIVAARSAGGLVAFTRKATGWEVLWETAAPYPSTPCDWAGPSIHDLDDDGLPEVIFYGAVYNGQTGATLDQALVNGIDATGVGYISVVADVDGDGAPELITGSRLYAWDKTGHRWIDKQGLPGANGHVAVGDLGTFPATGQPDRSRTDGIAETVVVHQGSVHVLTVDNREVFTAALAGSADRVGLGGPPILADFDGDGRLEIGTAGATAYNVLDPDCDATPEPATCASLNKAGVLWATPSQGTGAETTGSSAFDFDGDGRAEVAHADRCYARIYDGATGAVLYSRARTSCTWSENPVIADTDGDHQAELVISSNTSCGAACPAIDPSFDGVSCIDDSDCPSRSLQGPMTCGRDRGGDALGRCRCARDQDCGDGFSCSDPIAGPSPAGKVCRASHAAVPTTGVQVLADSLHRWGDARPIWNQHAYSVTNVDDDGHIPRTSQWLRNWTQAGLNNFRQSAFAAATTSARARPDLSIKQAKVTCDASSPTVSAEICNRGSAPVIAGLPVAVYAATTPSRLRCLAQTAAALLPGGCATVSCSWNGPDGDGAVVADDSGSGVGIARECREDNNAFPIRVSCPR